MPNAAAVALIAEKLPEGLTHPGDGKKQPPKLIPLPGLKNLGISPEQAKHFAQQAGMPANDAPKLIAEALVHLIETDLNGGSTIISNAELAQLRSQAATLGDLDPNAATVKVCCHCNLAKPVLHLAVGRAMVVLDGAALRKSLDDVCRCG
jgi:hypothetical protein